MAFCDADCQPEPQWLEAGLAALNHADLVAGRIHFLPPSRRSVWTLIDIDSTKDHERQVKRGTAETANLFLRRELYDRVSGFDDSIPEHGDFDFVERCVATGANLVFSPTAAVWHPARDTARPFLKMVWIMNRWYAARETRAHRKPEGLRLRSWVPVVQTFRGRRRFGMSIGPDRYWLSQNGIEPPWGDVALALPIMYIALPYLRGLARLQWWWDGRRLR